MTTDLWADLEAASREPGSTMIITKAQYAALRDYLPRAGTESLAITEEENTTLRHICHLVFEHLTEMSRTPTALALPVLQDEVLAQRNRVSLIWQRISRMPNGEK